jgi:hypothetical protein
VREEAAAEIRRPGAVMPTHLNKANARLWRLVMESLLLIMHRLEEQPDGYLGVCADYRAHIKALEEAIENLRDA